MLTMSGAVPQSRGTALCSWERALCYTTAARRLQRQRLCQQTQQFKAATTIVGSNGEERICLQVPKANWRLRIKTGSQRTLRRNNEEKNCSFTWNKSLNPQALQVASTSNHYFLQHIWNEPQAASSPRHSRF